MTKEAIIEHIKKYKTFPRIIKDLNGNALVELYRIAIEIDCHLVKYVPKKILINNASLMIKAVKQDLKLLSFIPREALENHPSICLKAVARYPYLLRIVPDKVKMEKPEICIDALKKDSSLMQYVPEGLILSHPKIRKICIHEVYNKPYLLKVVPDRLKIQQPEMCIDAVNKNNYLIQYVPNILKINNPEFCLQILENTNSVYKYIPVEILKKNPDLLIEIARTGEYSPSSFSAEIIKECPNILIEIAKTGKYYPSSFPKEMIQENPNILIEIAKAHYKHNDTDDEKDYEDDDYDYNYNYDIHFFLDMFSKEIIQKNPKIAIELAKINIDFFQLIPKESMNEYENAIIEIIKSDINNPRNGMYCKFSQVPQDILLRHTDIYEMIFEKLNAEHFSLKSIPVEIQEKYPDKCIKILNGIQRYYDEEYINNVLGISKKILMDNPEECLKIIANGYRYNYKSLSHVYENDSNYKGKRYIYDFLPKELFDDIDFVKKALEIDIKIIFYCSSRIQKELLDDIDFAQKAFKINKETFFCCNSRIQNILLNKEDNQIGIEWQNECLEEIHNKSNVILSAPTGSGKTKVFLEWALQKNGKPIFITAPIKAVSNQRYRELLLSGYTVGLETGDIKNVPENCDFICCTQEIYTNKYSKNPKYEDSTLIMDEFHYIFENANRARTYIDALHNSNAKNILLCSATMGNIEKLAKYVESVSNRKFKTYEGKNRLTELEYKGKISSTDIKNALVITFSQKNIELIIDNLKYQRDKINESKIEQIKQIAENYNIKNYSLVNDLSFGLAGYHSKLLPKEKLFIEECFEKGLIDTVVGTDALAMGVNFPVENVIFTQLAKYYDGPISKNLFDQIAGRAGRKGYYDKGYVYYCDDFKNERGYPLEAKGYNTKDLFGEYVFAKNEDVSIDLTPNIKNILLGETTIEEEAEYISRFSFPQKDLDETINEINNKMDEIVGEKAYEKLVDELLKEEFGYEEYDDEEEEVYYIFDEDDEEVCAKREKLLSLKEIFYKELPKIYFEEYSPEKNCKLFLKLLSRDDESTIKINEFVSSDFYELLQFRKYIKSLPKQYRKGMLKEIERNIRTIDEIAIDGYRGSISVDNITKQLDSEGKLDRNNVNKVLEEQKSIYGESLYKNGTEK